MDWVKSQAMLQLLKAESDLLDREKCILEKRKEKSQVMISYKHKDEYFAHKLEKALKAAGIKVWIDDKIQNGADWRSEIGQAIMHSEAVLFCMSPDACASKYCREEVYFASSCKVPIFPMQYKSAWDELMKTKGLKAILQRIQFTNFDNSGKILELDKPIGELMAEKEKLQKVIQKKEAAKEDTSAEQEKIAENAKAIKNHEDQQKREVDAGFDDAFQQFLPQLQKLMEWKREHDTSYQGVTEGLEHQAIEFHWGDDAADSSFAYQDMRKSMGTGCDIDGDGIVDHKDIQSDVFLCHAKADNKRAQDVKEKLERRGFTVNVPDENDLDKTIMNLDGAGIVVFVQSKHSHTTAVTDYRDSLGNQTDAGHCSDIIHAAYENNRPIIVLRFWNAEDVNKLMSYSMMMMLHMAPTLNMGDSSKKEELDDGLLDRLTFEILFEKYGATKEAELEKLDLGFSQSWLNQTDLKDALKNAG